MRFPAAVWNPDTFRWTAFRSMFGTQPFPLTGWESAVDFHQEVLAAPFEKGQGPAYAGFIGNGRQKPDVEALTSFTIDIDDGKGVHAALYRLKNDLLAQDISYLLQYRTSSKGQEKAHLIIPFSAPFTFDDPDGASAARTAFLDRLAAEYGFQPDRSVCRVNGIVFAYASRQGEPRPNQDANIGAYALDFHTIAPSFNLVPKRRRELKSTDEQLREFDAIKRALAHDSLMGEWNESKGAWSIICPHQHESDSRNKTLLYPSGYISCMAGRCAFKPGSWFIQSLSPTAQTIALEGGSARLRDSLSRAVVERVSLDEATRRLLEALGQVRPVDRRASVIRITTGAGKTRAIANHLNDYSAPAEDGFGRTAILATPTNALLREVEARIEIPHKRRVGVLAVLNDDGTPACLKHAKAKALQNAGGDIHRLMCGHCEHKEGCPARAKATIGDGALTLTNHALMPAVARDLHEAGRHPMIVWDESPQMTRSASLPREDLDWVLDLFREEADDHSMGALERIVHVQAFTPKYRAALRPLLEVLKLVSSSGKTTVDLGALADEWARLPYNEHLLHRALAVSDTAPQRPRYPGAGWDDIINAFTAAKRINVLNLGFDSMTASSQAKILRAERIIDALEVMGGTNAKVVASGAGAGGLLMACLTPNGVLWRDYGGVVLDATANLSELKALRPDVEVTNVAVEDAGDVERTAVYSGSLSRTALTASTGAFTLAVNRVHRRVGTGPTGPPRKVVVFTYKSQLELGKRLWPEVDWHHFGDTRGYDHWFQEGFSVYATVGDPVANLTALALSWMVIHGTDDINETDSWWAFVAASAESELAQAHGRARDPQRTKAEGEVGTIHMHFGRHIPAGWDLTNAGVDVALSGST